MRVAFGFAAPGFGWRRPALVPLTHATQSLPRHFTHTKQALAASDNPRATDATSQHTFVRQLQQIHRDGLLDRPCRVTEWTRRHGRKPKVSAASTAKSPWEDVTSHLSSHPDDVDYARETVQRFYHQLAEQAPENAVVELGRVALGRRILHWLLTTDDETRTICGWDFDFAQFLAHYITAEHAEEDLWQWLRQELRDVKYHYQRDRTLRHPFVHKYSWIGRLLGGLVAVRLARRLDQECLDDALQLMSHFEEFKTSQPAARYISKAAIAVAMKRAICNSSTKNTNPDLFDRFLKAQCDKKAYKIGVSNYDRAVLLLAHPTRPGPNPLLQHLREISSDSQALEFRPRSIEAAVFNQKRCEKLRELLMEGSRHLDAAWVEKLEQRFKSIVTNFDKHRRLSKATTLNQLHLREYPLGMK